MVSLCGSDILIDVIHFGILVIKMYQWVKMEEIDKIASLSAQGAWVRLLKLCLYYINYVS